MIDDFVFKSKKEGSRYLQLSMLQRAGEISQLEMQPKYIFKHNNIKLWSYTSDFSYYNKNGEFIVEDVKSPITKKDKVYRHNVKMMKAFYGITILET